MKRITTKQEMYKLLNSGQLGNTMQVLTKDNYEQYSLDTKVSVRSKVPGNPFVFLTARQVYNLLDNYQINVSTNDDNLILQGEIMRTHEGIYLRYSFDNNVSHREAMKTAKHATGVTAIAILRQYVAEDYELLSELLDLYDDHIVEFSTYSMPEGTNYRRTIVWEVRSY